MKDDKESSAKTYLDIAEYWDEHSLADHWDETEPAEFEISPSARRRYLVAIDPALLTRVQSIAQTRGLSTESLVNLFLEQHLQTLGA